MPSDAQWAEFEAAIAAVKLRGGRLCCNEERRIIEAIIWRLDNGAVQSPPSLVTGTMPTCVSAIGRLAVWDKIMAYVVAEESQNWLLPALMARLRGASEGRRAPTKQPDHMSLRFNRKTSGDNQALGRSLDEFGSKTVGVCDAAGRLMDFVLVPGQTHELAPSLPLPERLPKAPARTLADMTCHAKTFRSAVKNGCDPSGALA